MEFRFASIDVYKFTSGSVRDSSVRQEGRGIGLANKVAAYALQDGGLDTVDANRHLGFDDDLRSYEAVEHILADMGIKVRTRSLSGRGSTRGSNLRASCPEAGHSQPVIGVKHGMETPENMSEISRVAPSRLKL